MKNVMKPLVDAWFDLLDGNLTYGGQEVKVYKEDAANNNTFHYVLLRAESETDDSNKATFVTRAVVIVDIITVHPVSVKRSIVDEIDDQIRELIFPTRQHALVTDDFQILNVSPVSSMYLNDFDGTKKIYRKITRFINRINEI